MSADFPDRPATGTNAQLANALVFVLRQYFELSGLPDTADDEAVYENIRERLAELDRLRATEQVVRALHHPNREFGCCAACHLYTDEHGEDGPCLTARALGGRLLARGGEVTTDPDGVDNSDILHLPYPPSDPNLWDRERPRAFRPDLTEQDTPA